MSLRKSIIYSTLSFSQVYFTVRDDDKGVEILRIERTHSTFRTFATLFPNIVKNGSSMVKVTSDFDDVRMKAMICRERHDSRQFQFVYVNKRYVVKSKIRKYFNELLSKTNRSEGASRNVPPSSSSKARKYFVFIINICCSSDEYDVTLRLDERHVEFKNRKKIDLCLTKLAQQFWNRFSGAEPSTAPVAEANYLFKTVDVKTDTFVPKRIFEKLNYARTIFGLPVSRLPGEKKTSEYGTDLETSVMEKELAWQNREIDENPFVSECNDVDRVTSNRETANGGNVIEYPVLEGHYLADAGSAAGSVNADWEDANATYVEWDAEDVTCAEQHVANVADADPFQRTKKQPDCDTTIEETEFPKFSPGTILLVSRASEEPILNTAGLYRNTRKKQDPDAGIQEVQFSKFSAGTVLVPCASEEPILNTEIIKRYSKEKRELVHVWSVENANKTRTTNSKRKFPKNEVPNSSSVFSSAACRRAGRFNTKYVKTNSNIPFYNVKKRYHLNRMHSKLGHWKSKRLPKRRMKAQNTSRKPELQRLLVNSRSRVRYSLEITSTDEKSTNCASKKYLRKSILEIEDQRIDRYFHPKKHLNDGCTKTKKYIKTNDKISRKNYLRESVLKINDFKFSPKIISKFSGDLKSPYFDNFRQNSGQVKIPNSYTPFNNTWEIRNQRSVLMATFDSHKYYRDSSRKTKSIFTSDNFVCIPRINREKNRNCQKIFEFDEPPKMSICSADREQTTRSLGLPAADFSKDWLVNWWRNPSEVEQTRSLDLPVADFTKNWLNNPPEDFSDPKLIRSSDSPAADFSLSWLVDSRRNLEEINEKMTELRLDSAPNIQAWNNFESCEKMSSYEPTRDMLDNDSGKCSGMMAFPVPQTDYTKCCCKCHKREPENKNIFDYLHEPDQNLTSAVCDVSKKSADGTPFWNFEKEMCDDNWHHTSVNKSVEDAFCRIAPFDASFTSFPFLDDKNSASVTLIGERMDSRDKFLSSSPPLEFNWQRGPTRELQNNVPSQNCVTNYDDVNSFSETLVQKMRFKMKSKFFMSFPVTEIPKGMLEVPLVSTTKSNTVSLSREEKKDLRDLVEPCNMKNHITLGSFFNYNHF